MPTTVEKSLQRVFGSVSPHVPLAVKRPVKRAIPKRYYRFIDPEWHRWAIGGMWETIGKLQFDYLVEKGLQPNHYLLDVGCGPLRGGIHFIRYLEPGHYYGVEKDRRKLAAGRDVEIPQHGLEEKDARLYLMENFEFRALRQTFDYALAQSVFTHLPLNNIIRCLMEIERALTPGGRFYATFYVNPGGKRKLEDIQQTPTVTSHFDEDSFHYDVATFEWICDGTELEVENLGPWGHPHNQQMLRFTKRG